MAGLLLWLGKIRDTGIMSMRGAMKKIILIPSLLLALAAPAGASTIAFEDEAVLPAGGWQFNTILGCFPSTEHIEGSRVLPLIPGSLLLQLNQEIRYGLSERWMIRTTLPLSFLREGTQTAFGLGDAEFFLKALLIGEAESPFQAAFGFQTILHTAYPRVFGINGTTNLIPSLMLKQDLFGGALNALLGYQKALRLSDSAFAGLGWNTDLREDLNLVLEGLYSQDFSTRLLTLGPGLTWSFAPKSALALSLQLPAYRQGDFPATGPFAGLLQWSQEF